MNYSNHNEQALRRYHGDEARHFFLELPTAASFSLEAESEGALWKLSLHQGTFRHTPVADLKSVPLNKRICVLYGLGDGHYLKSLLSLSHVQEVLVFEPYAGLLHNLFSQQDLRPILTHPKLRLIIGQDKNTYTSRLERYFFEKIDRFCFAGNVCNLVSPGCEKLPGFMDACMAFAEAFKIAVNNVRVHAKFSKEDSYFGLINAIQNISLFKNLLSISDLSGKFQDTPAVVVATGPSLKHSIPILKKIQDSVVIIACDSAMGVLMQNEILPHFVVSLERVIFTEKFFKSDSHSTAILVAPSTMYPKALAAYSGPKMHMARDTGFDSWLYPDRPRYFLGQTVSQMALQVAAILGSPQIHLIGVDCAYDPDSGDSHHNESDGALQAAAKWIEDESGLSVVELPGHDGKLKKTWSGWLIDTQIIADMISRQGLAVLRVSPENYGLPIQHARRVDPDFLLKLENPTATPVSQKLEKIRRNLSPSSLNFERLRADAHQFLKALIQESVATLRDMTEFYFLHLPRFKENHALYVEYFEKLERMRMGMLHRNLYEGILHNILQGDYAEIGYSIHHESAENKNATNRIDKTLEYYRQWFSGLVIWSERILCLITVESK